MTRRSWRIVCILHAKLPSQRMVCILHGKFPSSRILLIIQTRFQFKKDLHVPEALICLEVGNPSQMVQLNSDTLRSLNDPEYLLN